MAAHRSLVFLIVLACPMCLAETVHQQEEQERLIRKHTSYWIYVFEILLVIILSLCFEKGQDKLAECFKTMGRQGKSLTMMMEKLSNEIMILGFIGLCVYCATKTNLALSLARRLYPRSVKLTQSHDPLAETFETVHMVIFCVMVCFISQVSLLMYKAVYLKSRGWSIWEHVRVGRFGEEQENVYGTGSVAIATFKGSRTTGSGRASLSRASTSVISSSVHLAKQGLKFMAEPEDHGKTLAAMLMQAGYCNADCSEFKPVKLESNPFKHILQSNAVLDLLQWRLIRHEFMFPSRRGGEDGMMTKEWGQDTYTPKEPASFHFSEYLDKKMGDAFVELIEVDIVTWAVTAVGALFMPWVASLGAYWYTTVAAVCSWTIVVLMFLFGVHITDVFNQLTPVLADPDPRAYVKSFKGTSATALKAAKIQKIPSLTNVPLLHVLQDALDKPLLEERQISDFQRQISPDRSLSQRFAKTKQVSAGCMCRPRYLLWLERLHLLRLEKAAPNEHDLLFFFHEASPDIYLHFIGDLLFLQSVVTSMYLVLYCIRDEEQDAYQSLVAILGFCGPLLNLLWLVPKIVGKTVIVFNIEHMKDKRAIEDVTFEIKKHQLLEAMKILQLSRMEGKVRRIMQEEQDQRELRKSTSPANDTVVRGLSKELTMRYERIFEKDFSDAKKKDIKHLFQMFDKDQSKSIEIDEMLAVLASMNIDVHSNIAESAKELWDLVDADGSGEIEWQEFRVLMAMLLSTDPKSQEEDCKALFRTFDLDGSGLIEIDELVPAFGKLGVELDADSIASLVSQVFKRSRQSMDEDDFMVFMNGLEEMAEMR